MMRMRTLVAGALALLSGGCLKAEVNRCGNGVICKDEQACTNDLGSKCGPPAQVDPCAGMGKQQFDSCDFPVPSGGACHAGVCDACTVDFAGCHFAMWTAMTSPSMANLTSIDVATFIDIDVVGASGTFLHYDGLKWNASSAVQDAIGASASAIAIWRSSDGARFVASSNGEVFRAPANTTTFSLLFDAGRSLTAISAGSPTDIVGVGDAGTIVEYDGTNVKVVTNPVSPTYTLNAVWVSPTGDAFAVGLAGGVLRRTNGTWSALAAPVGGKPELKAVWGRSASDVWITGAALTTQANVQHYDGVMLDAVAPAASTFSPVGLRTIWGDATRIWLAGDNGQIASFDGASWTGTSAPTNAPLNGVGGIAQEVFAVGDGGQIVRITTP
jgi:hypothetical protein